MVLVYFIFEILGYRVLYPIFNENQKPPGIAHVIDCRVNFDALHLFINDLLLFCFMAVKKHAFDHVFR